MVSGVETDAMVVTQLLLGNIGSTQVLLQVIYIKTLLIVNLMPLLHVNIILLVVNILHVKELKKHPNVLNNAIHNMLLTIKTINISDKTCTMLPKTLLKFKVKYTQTDQLKLHSQSLKISLITLVEFINGMVKVTH